LSQLQALAKKAKLTPEQQQAIKEVIAQVQQQMTDMANKTGANAQKSATDLQKSLPK
jgi:TRAP-type C4-dicarboxylate transport system substrate-binding protein